MSGTPEHPGLPEHQDPAEHPDAVAERAERRAAALKAHHRHRRWRARALAAAAGTGALALVAGVAAAGSLLPTSTPEVDGSARPAQLAATGMTSVCPPAPRLPDGAAEGTDAQFTPVSSSAESAARVVMLSDLAGRFPGATLGPATPDGPQPRALTDAQPVEVQQGSAATADEDGVPVHEASAHTVDAPGADAGMASVAALEPLGGQTPVASAVYSYSAGDGDLAGLAAAACQAPSHRHWLSGATTTVGTTSVLTVVNPSVSPATVDLELFGAEGPVEGPGTSGIVLAPGASTSLILGGLAPDQEHLAVAVHASGGAVTATIQQHRLDGATPAGVDLIQAGVAPRPLVVLPGVRVPTEQVLEGLTDPAAGPSVMIAAPITSGPVTAEVVVSGAGGEVPLPGESVVSLQPGSTARVPLAGLSSGEYTVTVRANAPVLASSRGLEAMDVELPEGSTGQPVDTAVMPSAEPLGLEQLVAVPDNGPAALVLSSPEGGAVEVAPVLDNGSMGEPRLQELGPAGHARLAVDSLSDTDAEVVGLLITTTTAGQVHAGLTVRSAQGIAAVPVPAQQEEPAGVPVSVRP